MSATGAVLLLLVGPGVVFFVLSGKYDELKSPSGWLIALPFGLICSFIAACIFTITGKAEAVLYILTGKFTIYIIDFGLIVYIAAAIVGMYWRIFRLSKKPSKLWLRLEKRFRTEGDLFVARNLLEHLLFICYAAKISPEFNIILASNKEVRGKCIKYQWTEPRSLLLLVDGPEKDNTTFLLIPISSIQAIYLLNWLEIKNSKKVDEWEYIRFIDERLPDMLRGKKDGCD